GAVPLTYLYAEDLSLSALLDALRAGRTFVSSGPELTMRAVAEDGREWPLGATVPPSARIEASCHRSPKAELRMVSGGTLTAGAGDHGGASQVDAQLLERGSGRLEPTAGRDGPGNLRAGQGRQQGPGPGQRPHVLGKTLVGGDVSFLESIDAVLIDVDAGLAQ